MTEESLEQKIEVTEEKVDLLDVRPLDEFVKSFTTSYRGSKDFQKRVHKYLKLKPLSKAKLAVSKRIMKKWYKKRTDEIIAQYAVQVREAFIKKNELEKMIVELRNKEEVNEQTADQYRASVREYNEARVEYQQAETAEEEAKKEINEKFDKQIQKTEERRNEKVSEISKREDATIIARRHLTKYVSQSEMLSVSETGVLSFDEQKIAQAIEDTLLEEVLEEIKGEEGGGFMTRVKEGYNSVITHFDPLENPGDIGRTDWAASVVESRLAGYKKITYPHLIVSKMSYLGKTSIDTATAIDCSGSMKQGNRWEMAKKTALALNSAMRKLNPKNNTYMSRYNYENKPMSNTELIRGIIPTGGTNTHLAVDWQLKTLMQHDVGIAYLITDGHPNYLDETINAARKFREHPYIFLRIFLINDDNDKSAVEAVRQIGMAAGDNSKAVHLKGYQLAGSLIKDVSTVFDEMVAINEF